MPFDNERQVNIWDYFCHWFTQKLFMRLKYIPDIVLGTEDTTGMRQSLCPHKGIRKNMRNII